MRQAILRLRPAPGVRWTRDEALRVGAHVARKLGYVPLTTDWHMTLNRPHQRIVNRLFGSRAVFVRELERRTGIKARPSKTVCNVSREELLMEAVRRLRAWMKSDAAGLWGMGRVTSLPQSPVNRWFGNRANLRDSAARALGFKSFTDLWRHQIVAATVRRPDLVEGIRSMGGHCPIVRSNKRGRPRYDRPFTDVINVATSRLRVSYRTVRRLFGSTDAYFKAVIRADRRRVS